MKRSSQIAAGPFIGRLPRAMARSPSAKLARCPFLRSAREKDGMRKAAARAICLLVSCAMVFTCAPQVGTLLFPGLSASAYAASEIDDVKAMIEELPLDPREFGLEDKDHVESIVAAYDALSAEDQASLDSTLGSGLYLNLAEVGLWANSHGHQR